jgi:hypothetical protein
MSEIKVNKISPKQTCTQLTLGDSGDTIIIPAGATITNNGTATGFGRTGTVDWDTTVKTTGFTAVSGTGYFCNTTSGAFTVTLPSSPSAGAIVAVSDYANTAATNNITINPDGTDKINGVNRNATISTNGVAVTLIYVDSTIGWKDVNDSTLDVTGINTFVAATGGTILTCGDYKTHVFTGPGTFTVTNAGTPAGSNSVEYLVVAGGAGSSGNGGGGGGAGGYRQNYPSPTTAGLPVSVQGYPITVGGGGAGVPDSLGRGGAGVNSVFSTITSTGGGGGGGGGPTGPGGSGGSGGGSHRCVPAGSGNTPPVSPSQGNPGGIGSGLGGSNGGGGGGATAAGAISPSGGIGGNGGSGSPIATAFFGTTAPSYGTSGPAPGRYFSGGGGGGGASGTTATGGAGGGGDGRTSPSGGAKAPSGTTNTGGGGGGGSQSCTGGGGDGGSGIVVIRYKFQ